MRCALLLALCWAVAGELLPPATPPAASDSLSSSTTSRAALDFAILGPRDGDILLLTPQQLPVHLQGYRVEGEAQSDATAVPEHASSRAVVPVEGEACVHGLAVPVANWDPRAMPFDALDEGLALARACLADRLAAWRAVVAALPVDGAAPDGAAAPGLASPEFLSLDASVPSCLALGRFGLRHADPVELAARLQGRGAAALDELVLRLGTPWTLGCTPIAGPAALKPLVNVEVPRSLVPGDAALVALHVEFRPSPETLAAHGRLTPAAAGGRATAFLHVRPPGAPRQHVFIDGELRPEVPLHPPRAPVSQPYAVAYLAYSDPYVRGVRASALSLLAARLAFLALDVHRALQGGVSLEAILAAAAASVRPLDVVIMVGCKAPPAAWAAAAAATGSGSGGDDVPVGGAAPIPRLLQQWVDGAVAAVEAFPRWRTAPQQEAAEVSPSGGAGPTPTRVNATAQLAARSVVPCTPMLSASALQLLEDLQATVAAVRRGLLQAALGHAPFPLAAAAGGTAATAVNGSAVPPATAATAAAAALVTTCTALGPSMPSPTCEALVALLDGSLLSPLIPAASSAALDVAGDAVPLARASLAAVLSAAAPAPLALLPVPWLQGAAEGLPLMGLDAGLWLKLHAWALTAYPTVLLLDSDTLVQGRLEPLWEALDRAGPAADLGGPALNPDEADNTIMNVQFVALRPSLAGWRGHMSVLARHSVFHLAETTFLNWYYWGTKLCYLGHVCLAESLDTHEKNATAQAALASTGFPCPLLDFSSCTYNRFKPWQPREPPSAPGEYCRHPPGPLFKAAVAAWRAVDAAAAAAAAAVAAA